MPDRRRACLLALLAALGGCGGAQRRPADTSSLLYGSASPISPTGLDHASATARHFVAAYAESIYDPTPTRLPAASPEVNRELRSAAARVPPPRIGRRVRVVALTITPESPTRIRAAVKISDGRSPPFSVGFTLQHLDDGWRVTSISPPS